MKVTDPQVIENGEKDLIAAVQKNLDLNTVKEIFLKDRMAETSFLSKGGQIVVYDNQIAFRLDFDLNLSGSLLFDRQGNYIPAASPIASMETKKEDDDGNTLDLDQDNLLDGKDLDPNDMLNDDINDILKESREFWKQKKED